MLTVNIPLSMMEPEQTDLTTCYDVLLVAEMKPNECAKLLLFLQQQGLLHGGSIPLRMKPYISIVQGNATVLDPEEARAGGVVIAKPSLSTNLSSVLCHVNSVKGKRLRHNPRFRSYSHSCVTRDSTSFRH